MKKSNKDIEAELTPEEMAEFEEKFCHGTMKARILTEEEIAQLKREGRI